MKPRMFAAMALAVCMGGCVKATGRSTGQVSSSAGRSVWKGDEEKFVSMFRKRQNDNLLRLAQERAAEKALQEELSSRREGRESVPPSMYRTTEPPLPEPDFSLPVPDVARPAPDAGSPTPSPSPEPQQ